MVLLADPAPGRSRCRKRNLQRDGALDTWRKRSTPSQIQRVASPNIIVSTGSEDSGNWYGSNLSTKSFSGWAELGSLWA